MELYVDDEKLNKLIYNLKINTLKYLSPNPPKYLFSLKHNNFEFEQYEKMPIDNPENIAKKSEKFNELLDKRKVIFEEYNRSLFCQEFIGAPENNRVKSFAINFQYFDIAEVK